MSKELKLKYIKLYAYENGETHFSDEELIMTETGYAPPAPPLWVGPSGKATGLTVIGFPPGWYGDFHPVPKPQWMMIMTGSVEVEVSDGEKRIFEAGTIGYLDDVGSRGHCSRTIGDELSIVTVTEVG